MQWCRGAVWAHRGQVAGCRLDAVVAKDVPAKDAGPASIDSQVMRTESPAPLRRRYDENTGPALIDVEDTSPIVEPDPLRHGLAPAH